MATVRKTVMTKKVGSTVYNVYAKTSADIVEILKTGNVTSDVQTEINALIAKMGTFDDGNDTVKEQITAQVDAAVKMLLGADSQSELAQALDTIKEISEALAGNNDEENPVQGLLEAVSTLKTEVENVDTGLLKKVANIRSELDGTDREVDDGEGGTRTEHTNGVYDRLNALESGSSALNTDTIAAGPSGNTNFVTAAEKQRIADTAIVQFLESTATDADITSTSDLYFVDIASA